MNEFKSLSYIDNLTVVTQADSIDELVNVISSRTYNARHWGVSDNLPDAVLIATSVSAVQQAIHFCRENNWTVCVRSGGHAWYPDACWLRGKGTILLDVGDLKSVSIIDTTLSIEPGATGDDVLQALPDHLYFPGGHCPDVALGGFILGSGYGLGFTKYGLTSMLVSGVNVVLASGELVEANIDSTDPTEQAIMSLVTGAASCFPGVITKYIFKNLPARPTLLSGKIIFDLSKDWNKALRLVLDIQFRGDEDALNVETLVVITSSPPDLAEETGVGMCAIVTLALWGDTEEHAMELWTKYTSNVTDPLVPLTAPLMVAPQTEMEEIGSLYPQNAKYDAETHVGCLKVHDMTDMEIAELLQPVIDMWLAEDTRPPPPSHTLVVPIHPSFRDKSQRGKDTTNGFTPSFVVLSYNIYQDDATHDNSLLRKAHERLAQSPAFYTQMSEGNVKLRGKISGFTPEALEHVKASIALLDPTGVFPGLTD